MIKSLDEFVNLVVYEINTQLHFRLANINNLLLVKLRRDCFISLPRGGFMTGDASNLYLKLWVIIPGITCQKLFVLLCY